MSAETNATLSVLVVDDCRQIRSICAKLLRARGHVVHEAAFAEEALRVWDQHAGRVDVLLTDLVMPGRSGAALASELRARRPSLGIVLMSAVPAQLRRAQDQLDGACVALSKPFSAAMLVDAVETAGAMAAPPRVTTARAPAQAATGAKDTTL